MLTNSRGKWTEVLNIDIYLLGTWACSVHRSDRGNLVDNEYHPSWKREVIIFIANRELLGRRRSSLRCSLLHIDTEGIHRSIWHSRHPTDRWCHTRTLDTDLYIHRCHSRRDLSDIPMDSSSGIDPSLDMIDIRKGDTHWSPFDNRDDSSVHM